MISKIQNLSKMASAMLPEKQQRDDLESGYGLIRPVLDQRRLLPTMYA